MRLPQEPALCSWVAHERDREPAGLQLRACADRNVAHLRGSGGAEQRKEAALEYARHRFPRFFDAQGSAGGGSAASESGMEVVLEEGDAIFFPAFWFHYTETLDLSFSLGYRFLDLQA